ncbi:hypothetical protein KSW81_002069 [Nannochloris sp. 'desiccata']|nr:hypothetical protein KSW81_002069 [Chlorella desiccata (nom. nud.)]
MPLPAVASSSLLATIQRSNGELEHLHAALARIEDILADERSRAATLREKAHREAQQSATHVQTLGELESATISCASKTSIIEKLQTQVAQARTKLSEIEANKSKTVAAMQSENELLRLRLKEARAELAFARNDTAERKAQAGIILLASQRQALCERLQQAQNTIAANSAGIAELQGQVAALHREGTKAELNAVRSEGTLLGQELPHQINSKLV